MRKSVRSIVTNADIQRMNDFILTWQRMEETDPEMSLLRSIILDIRNYDIPTQMVVYTLLKNEMNVIAAAADLGVTKPAIYSYLNKWRRNVVEKFGKMYAEYDAWIDSVTEAAEPDTYTIIMNTED